jgi:hypothetical protein
MNNYQKTVNKIEKVTAQIKVNAQRDSEARLRLAGAEKALEDHKKAFKKVLIDGDPKKIAAMEKEVEHLKLEVLQRDTLLLDALESEVKTLEFEKSQLEAEAAREFSKNAVGVIQSLAGQFDSHAREVIKTGKRLVAIHNLLREHGHGSVFRQTLGPATDVLGTFRVPIIKDFELSAYNDRNQLFAGSVFDEMRKTIEEA